MTTFIRAHWASSPYDGAVPSRSSWVLRNGRWEAHILSNPYALSLISSGRSDRLPEWARINLGVDDISLTDPNIGRRDVESLWPSWEELNQEILAENRILSPEEINQRMENVISRLHVSKDKEKNTGFMQTLKMTKAGALIEDSRFTIPEQARISLDKFANNKLKDLKLVTKAFKFTFPFYQAAHQRRSFRKLFDLLKKTIERVIPYVTTAKTPFINTGLPSSDTIFIRLGPFTSANANTRLARYIRYVGFLINKHGLPLVLSSRFTDYTNPRDSTTRYGNGWSSTAERDANTFQIFEIKLRLNNIEGERGYLLLYHVDSILRSLETLHRLAHYAESTYTRAPRDTVGNR